MTDITKLIEDACDCARQIGITEAGRAHGCFTRDDSRFLTTMQQSKAKHVAALQSAIEALQATQASQSMQLAHDAVTIECLNDKVFALQAENERLKTENDNFSYSMIAAANRKLREDNNALQAKLDELQRQEPIYQYMRGDGCWIDQTKASYDYNRKHGASEVRIVYAAPKALTEDVSYATTVMALIEDYAKAVHDGDDNSCTVLRRTIKASLEQPPKAMEPEPLIKFRHGCKWCGKAKCAAGCYGITKGTPT